ncbi:MAG: type II secretion system F family protein, partial [Acidimicrobiales bacterium]
LRRVVLATRLGRPLDEALQDTADRMSSPDFEWVVLAIGIQREVGGNLAELLTTVADTMLSREQLRREVQALTAEGKLSAIIIGLLPIGLAVAISVLNPGYLSILFTTSVGKALVLVAVLLATAGFFWMRKTIQVEV